jgi:hypothetical protein
MVMRSTAAAVTPSRTRSCAPANTATAAPTPASTVRERGGRLFDVIASVEAMRMTSSVVASASAAWMCSGIPALGPNGIPMMREISHVMTMPVLRATPAATASSLGERAIHSAQASCASPDASMKAPAAAHWRMWGRAELRWIAAAPMEARKETSTHDRVNPSRRIMASLFLKTPRPGSRCTA